MGEAEIPIAEPKHHGTEGAADADQSKTPEISEYAKWALDQNHGGDEKPETQHDEGDDDPGPTKELPPEKKEWQRIERSKINNTKTEKTEFEKALDNATDILKEAEKKVRDSKSKSRELEGKLK